MSCRIGTPGDGVCAFPMCTPGCPNDGPVPEPAAATTTELHRRWRHGSADPCAETWPLLGSLPVLGLGYSHSCALLEGHAGTCRCRCGQDPAYSQRLALPSR